MSDAVVLSNDVSQIASMFNERVLCSMAVLARVEMFAARFTVSTLYRQFVEVKSEFALSWKALNCAKYQYWTSFLERVKIENKGF